MMENQQCFNGEAGMENGEYSRLQARIEQACKTYKLSELYFREVGDDYGKQKLARLRLEFARHELAELLKEAVVKGLHVSDNEMLRRFY